MDDIEDLPLRKSEIVSASRRTDIPAHYLPWFIRCIQQGYIKVPNPRNKTQISKVSLSPQDVVCIVWWSKDYKNWIETYLKNPDIFNQYKGHIFQFTLNSESPLEHLKSSLEERLKQLAFLAQNFGPNSISLRFDPIVHWRDIGPPQSPLKNNLNDFRKIIETASQLGIKFVIFSFCLAYPKVRENMRKTGKLLQTPPLEGRKTVLDNLLRIATTYGVTLRCCSESNLIGYEGKCGGIIQSSKCIDGLIIETITGTKLKKKGKDCGQRKACNCTTSRDIGSYDMQCPHGCDYCYANPIISI